MGKKSKVKNMTPGITDTQNALANYLAPRVGTGASRYGGSMIADLLPGMSAIQNQLQTVDLSQGLAQQRAALSPSLSGVPSQTLNEQDTTRFFKDAVATPMLRTWDRDIAPRLDQSFAGLGGTFSSRRSLARQDSLDNLATSLTSQLGQAQLANQQMNAQLYEQAAQRQLQAVQLMEMLANAPATRGQQMTQALSPFQAYAQSKADSQFAEFMRMAPENDPWMKMALGSLGSQPQTAVQQGNNYSGLIGALGAIAAPFTGGLSLGLTAAGAGLGSGGGDVPYVPGPNPY